MDFAGLWLLGTRSEDGQKSMCSKTALDELSHFQIDEKRNVLNFVFRGISEDTQRIDFKK